MTVRILTGDCRDHLSQIDASSIDSIVTDPPYGLSFMGKGWDHGVPGIEFWVAALRVLKPGGHLLAFGGTRTHHRLMVAIEDAGFEIRDCLMWLYGQGFPKSHNIRKAAIREGWGCSCEGSALPYSHEQAEPQAEYDMRSVRQSDVSQAVNAGDQRWEVLQSVMPEHRAPAAGWSELSASEIRGGQSGMEGRGDLLSETRELQADQIRTVSTGVSGDGSDGRVRDGAPFDPGENGGVLLDTGGSRAPHRPRSTEQRTVESGTLAGQSEPQVSGTWPICGRCGLSVVPEGLGTALKPSYEPIILARKPLIGSVAANVTAHGTGALNIDGCRIATEEVLSAGNRRIGDGIKYGTCEPTTEYQQNLAGRWPANVVLDEDAAALLDAQSGERKAGSAKTGLEPKAAAFSGNLYGDAAVNGQAFEGYGDTGGASRFFYVAKASSAERNRGLSGLPERRVDPVNHTDQRVWDIPGSHATPRANHHPTVKPIALMQWLCRLVTPPGGTVLDPFMGSGSTLIAASREGFNAVGIELDPEYAEIARRRITGDCPLFVEVA